LRGSQPTLSVTFDQQTATENPDAMHIWVGHPLVRQAAEYFKFDEPREVTLLARSSSIPEGDYVFALYRWVKRGLTVDETIVPISSEREIEKNLMNMLATATVASIEDHRALSPKQLDDLEMQHHFQWTRARADHIVETRHQVEHRVQSLTVSHRARIKTIEDQISRSSNEKIVLMKASELSRANQDFDGRIAELQTQADSGDIHSSLVFHGIVRVDGGN
jgi:hypothetical protein